MAQCRCFGADITINRGEDRTVRFIVSDRDGKPVDLSGSAFSVNVYAVPGAEQGAPALAASQSALVSARYKSSTSSGTTLSQASSWSTYVWGNYTTTNASNYYYSICCTASRVYFKTNGNYRFRVGTTYKYIIVMDEQ